MNQDLSTRGLLVRKSTSRFYGNAYDRDISEKNSKEYGTGDKKLRTYKDIIDKGAPSFAAVRTAFNALDKFHKANTLRWDDGVDLLPGANVVRYKAGVSTLEKAIYRSVDQFVIDLPALVEKARKELNGAFKEEDYPSQPELKGMFRVKIVYDPIPSVEAARRFGIAEDFQARINEKEKQAMDDLWMRLVGPVQKLAEMLSSDKTKKYHKSLLDNVEAIVDLLPTMNISNDPALAGLEKEIREKLLDVNILEIRESEYIRGEKAEAAADIVKKIGGLRAIDF